MDNFDPEIFEIKFTIADAAAKQYEKQGKNFTLHRVAEEVDLDVANIFEYFPNKKAILLFYYEAIIVRYLLMLQEIEGFEDYTLAEKLSNFAYTSFDLFGEHEEFVRQTFRPLILCSYTTTEFEAKSRQLIKDFFTSDPRISMSSSLLTNDYLYSLLYKKYTALIRFWLKEESEGKEVSMELTDKYTVFLQEIMYNTTIDKGLELAKFLFTNNIFGRGFESIKKLFPEIEIRD
ncbi:TetR/AcrR family transcriptional regulator [Aliifodinibius sp. S!AR15-10]|uniref:TetR/AcrR family transcriptional regulator n=1 Tax=Aliifodinibius sp. S!AR15-10 TaxID=2950437 RepID=UPI00286112A7|nr:TetR/AcrR family transcriptional regulator [Aliifodinibius sp. S!AR15-10]MDR8392101.1 TetR/AcrR family transcriptional regulator [Aliifodinibius sp. S!AR15-10]